jgi:two-component system chemotaxis response regulator CheB
VKHAGGRVLVQDPAEAVFGEMPRSVLEHVAVDAVGPAAGIPGVAVDLATTMPPVGGARSAEPPERGGDDMATGLTCPDCGGALWERGPEAADRFECRVGHSFGAETLVASHDENLENVLWSAVRAFEERAELGRRLEERFRRRGDAAVAERYRRRVDESMRHAASLRDALVGGDLVDVAEEA